MNWITVTEAIGVTLEIILDKFMHDLTLEQNRTCSMCAWDSTLLPFSTRTCLPLEVYDVCGVFGKTFKFGISRRKNLVVTSKLRCLSNFFFCMRRVRPCFDIFLCVRRTISSTGA